MYIRFRNTLLSKEYQFPAYLQSFSISEGAGGTQCDIVPRYEVVHLSIQNNWSLVLSVRGGEYSEVGRRREITNHNYDRNLIRNHHQNRH